MNKKFSSTPTLKKEKYRVLKPFRAIRKFFKGTKKSSKVMSLSTGSIYTRTNYEDDLEQTERFGLESEVTSSNYRRVISMSHESVFASDQHRTQIAHGYRPAVSQEFLNFITVPGGVEQSQVDFEDFQLDSSIEDLPPDTPLYPFKNRKLDENYEKISAMDKSTASIDMDSLPTAQPLQNSAAKDRIAVRPKRRPPTRAARTTKPAATNLVKEKPRKSPRKQENIINMNPPTDGETKNKFKWETSKKKPIPRAQKPRHLSLNDEDNARNETAKKPFINKVVSPTALKLQDIQKVELKKTTPVKSPKPIPATRSPQTPTFITDLKPLNPATNHHGLAKNKDVTSPSKRNDDETTIVSPFPKLKKVELKPKDEETKTDITTDTVSPFQKLRTVSSTGSDEKENDSDGMSVVQPAWKSKLKPVKSPDHDKSSEQEIEKPKKLASPNMNKNKFSPFKTSESEVEKPKKSSFVNTKTNESSYKKNENSYKAKEMITAVSYTPLTEDKIENELDIVRANIKSKNSFKEKSSQEVNNNPAIKKQSSFKLAQSKFKNTNSNNNSVEIAQDVFQTEQLPEKSSSKPTRSISWKVPKNTTKISRTRAFTNSEIGEDVVILPPSLKSTGNLDNLLDKENMPKNDVNNKGIYERVTNSVFKVPEPPKPTDIPSKPETIIVKPEVTKSRAKSFSVGTRNLSVAKQNNLNDKISEIPEGNSQPTWVSLARSRSTKWDSTKSRDKEILPSDNESIDILNNNRKATTTPSWQDLAMQKQKRWMQEVE